MVVQESENEKTPAELEETKIQEKNDERKQFSFESIL